MIRKGEAAKGAIGFDEQDALRMRNDLAGEGFLCGRLDAEQRLCLGLTVVAVIVTQEDASQAESSTACGRIQAASGLYLRFACPGPVGRGGVIWSTGGGMAVRLRDAKEAAIDFSLVASEESGRVAERQGTKSCLDCKCRRRRAGTS